MGDENPIRTLGDYSIPSYEGYRNTIELPAGNNVAPLRSDTIQLVQNGCSFHRLRFEDPNQHLKDFLKLVDSFDLDGESLLEAWTSFKDLLQKVPHHGIDLWLQVQIFYDHVNPITRRTIDESAGGKLRDRNAKESRALLEDLALYDNESWNDPRDLAKPVKAITLPQDVPSTSDHHLIELENQVQRLMEAHLAPTQPTQVNKITTSCDICSGPHDTHYCMEDLEQAFVEYASSRTNETRPHSSYEFHYLFQSSIIEQNKNSSSPKRVHFVNSIIILNKDNEAEEEGSVEPNKTKYTNRENSNETDEEVESEKEVKEETEGETEEEEGDDPEHFDTFPTMKELSYHDWLSKNPRPHGLEPRRKPSNPKKNCNFVGRVKGLSVFVGNFTYEGDFMVLEDTTSVIDHYLGSVVCGKPFMKATGLVYNKEEVTVVLERDKERIIFKMPHKRNMFKHVDFTDRGTYSIHPFVIESDDDNCEKTHYSDSLDIGPEYKYVCRGIQSLMATKARRKNKGEVT
ncbi:hypothetical protein Tco_0618478 [Tanacetum coccineum]